MVAPRVGGVAKDAAGNDGEGGGRGTLGIVGGGIDSSNKLLFSPEKVDDALGSSVLLCRNGDDGAEMIICGLTFKK